MSKHIIENANCKFPDTVWQYTDEESVKSILTNQNLWLTNFAYQNDPQEALEFSRHLKIFLEAHPKRKLQIEFMLKHIDQLLGITKTSIPDQQLFITCFSCDGDLANQWEIYGDYALGFDFKLLNQHGMDDQKNYKTHEAFKTAIYTDQEKQKTIKEMFETLDCEIAELWTDVEVPKDVPEDVLMNDMMDIMLDNHIRFAPLFLRNLVRFKEPNSYKEREFRIASFVIPPGRMYAKFVGNLHDFAEFMGRKDRPIKSFYSPRRKKYVPYIEKFTELAALPITTIKVGPTEDQVERIAKMKAFVDELGKTNQSIGPINVVASSIPFQKQAGAT